jgi:hypothetical protein
LREDISSSGISLDLAKVGTIPMLQYLYIHSPTPPSPQTSPFPARVVWTNHVQKRSRVAVVGEGGEELHWPRQSELASHVQPYANFVSRAAQALIGTSHWMAADDSALGIRRSELATLAGILHTSLPRSSSQPAMLNFRRIVVPCKKERERGQHSQVYSDEAVIAS